MRRLIGLSCRFWLILGAAVVSQSVAVAFRPPLPSAGTREDLVSGKKGYIAFVTRLPSAGPEVSFDVFRPPVLDQVFEKFSIAAIPEIPEIPDLVLTASDSGVGGAPGTEGYVDVYTSIDRDRDNDIVVSTRVTDELGLTKLLHDMDPGPDETYTVTVTDNNVPPKSFDLIFSPVLVEPPTTSYARYNAHFELDTALAGAGYSLIPEIPDFPGGEAPPPSEFDVQVILENQVSPTPPPIPAGTLIGRWTITGVIIPEPSSAVLIAAAMGMLVVLFRRRNQ